MKLLVSDLDGTLFDEGVLDHERRCSERNAKAVRGWVKSGNRFAVATARSLKAKAILEQQLGIAIDFIGGNGVELSFTDGTTCYQGTPIRYFYEICDWLNENQVDATAVTKLDDKWLISAENKYPAMVPDRYRYFIAEGTVASRIENDAICPYVGVFVHQDARDELKGKLIEKFGEKLEIVCADSDDIDLMVKGISKAYGIKKLVEKLGISLEDVIVVGDSENDVCMFELVEKSYCMSHSEASIQKKAAFLADSVAQVIEIELHR